MSNSDYKTVIDQLTNKKFNRRNFLISAGVISGGISIGGLLTYLYRNSNIEPPYSKAQLNIISSLHNHLLPKSDNAPGAPDINSTEYLEFVLLDRNVDEEDRNLLKNGVVWLEEASVEMFKKSFTELEISEKDDVLRSIEEYNWGYRYLSLNLTFLIEALLADPIYGGNVDEIGWKWLEHTPGLPRPTNTTRYKKR